MDGDERIGWMIVEDLGEMEGYHEGGVMMI